MAILGALLLVSCASTSAPAGPSVSSSGPEGIWEAESLLLRLEPGGAMTIAPDSDAEALPIFESHWSLAGDTLTLDDATGECAAGEATRTGTYRLTIGADGLAFAKLADACEGRAGIDGMKWSRVAPASLVRPGRAGDGAGAGPPPLAVLFVGNSYTYMNDLPGMVQSLAAGSGRAVDAESVLVPGASLENHWTNGAVAALLAGAHGQVHHHDVVVLQEQSQRPLREREAFLRFAALLAGKAKEAGTRVVFFLPWARRQTPELQDRLTDAYAAAAHDAGAALAPAGPAWQAALHERPQLVLHAPDGSHPSPLGSYLAALVLTARITGQSPASLPARVTHHGHPVVDLGGDAALLALLRRAASSALAAAP